MKNTIFSFLTAAGLLFAGCHQPDELLPSVSRNGINSVTAQFVKNNSEGAAEFYGEFKGYPAEGSDEITVEIPWFYPESSDDVVSGKMLDKMRISLNLDDNVTVDPAVLYMNLNEAFVSCYDFTRSGNDGYRLECVAQADRHCV